VQYVSFSAAVLVALITLYSGFWRSGTYLLVRAGAGALYFLLPHTPALWGLNTLLWWTPSVALGAVVGGAVGALPALLCAGCTLLGALEGTAVLQALGLLYAWWFLLLLAREAQCKRGPDDLILLVAVVGGGISLLCGVLWGWHITLWCSLWLQAVIGAVLWCRPEFSDNVVED